MLPPFDPPGSIGTSLLPGGLTMLCQARPLAARRILASAILGLVAASSAVAATFTGRVVGVADGDTVTVLVDGNTQVKVRLNGIDAPEKSQAFGNRAKQFTSEQCFGQTVTVDDQGVDKYGRTVGEVILADGTNLNVALVENGFAWWYEKYAPDDARFADAEARARAAKRGLWSHAHAIPPWEFRKLQRDATRPLGGVVPGVTEATVVPKAPRVAPYRQPSPAPAQQGFIHSPPTAAPQMFIQAPPVVHGSGSHWLTISSSKRHNPGCKYFQNSNGRPCGPTEGTPCKLCGG